MANDLTLRNHFEFFSVKLFGHSKQLSIENISLHIIKLSLRIKSNIILLSMCITFAIAFSIVIFNVMSKHNFTTAHSIISWSTFTYNGITFGYPSHWKVIYISNNEIQFVNSSNPFNRFAVGLPKRNNMDVSNILEYANDIHYPNATIIEPFQTAIVGEDNAAIGKLRLNISNAGDIISHMIILNHYGKLYVFQYINTPFQFYSDGSQQTRNRIFTSISFR
ncbi:MAG: hypothetical protein ACTHKK_01935 [Candidatus Nitrosocosmicus sp.]